MRYLVRLLLFSLVLAPVSYLFGLPFLVTKLEEKMRVDQYVQCEAHLKKEGLATILKTEQMNSYCRCVSDAVKLQKSDIKDMVLRKPPQALYSTMRPAIDACNAGLQKSIGTTRENLPKPRTVTKPDGTQIIHFN